MQKIIQKILSILAILLLAGFALASGTLITNVNPTDNTYVNDNQHTITATLVPTTGSTINTSALRVTVLGVEYDVTSPSLSFNSTSNVLTFTPVFVYTEGDSVRATIEASDTSGLTESVDITFVVDTIPPARIDDLDADLVEDTNGNVTGVTLNWTTPDVQIAPIVSYSVARTDFLFADNEFADYVIATDINSTTYQDTNADTNTTVYYKVRTLDAAGNTSQPSEARRVIIGTITFSGDDDNEGLDSDTSIDSGRVIVLGDDVIVQFLDLHVALEKGSSINLPIVITNNESHGVAFELDADFEDEEDDEDIRVVIPESYRRSFRDRFNSHNIGRAFPFSEGKDVILLNSNESIALDITVFAAVDATEDDYDIRLDLEMFDVFNPNFEELRGRDVQFVDRTSVIFEVEVVDEFGTTDEGIDFLGTGTNVFNICREDSETLIPLELDNEGADERDVKLYAEPVGGVLVRFTPNEIDIDDERHVDMVVHTNSTTKPGIYRIPVYARNENFFVQRTITLQVIACGNQPFFLALTNVPESISSGKTADLEYALVNRTNKPQKINLVSQSDLATVLEPSEIYLPAGATAKGFLRIIGRQTDKQGLHKMQLFAINETGDYRTAEFDIGVDETISFTAEAEKTDKPKKQQYPFLPKELTKKDKKEEAEGRLIVGFFGLTPASAVGYGILALVVLIAALLVKGVLEEKKSKKMEDKT